MVEGASRRAEEGDQRQRAGGCTTAVCTGSWTGRLLGWRAIERGPNNIFVGRSRVAALILSTACDCIAPCKYV